MQCQEFEDRLNALLDNRHDPHADSALAAHTGHCRACEEKLRGTLLVLSVLPRLDRPPLSAGFANGVLKQAAASSLLQARPADRSTARAGKLWLAAAALLGSAAAVLLGLSIVWYARSGNEASGLAKDEQDGALHAVAIDERSLAGASPQRGASGGGTLATANFLIEAPRIPDHVRGGYRGAMDNLANSLPETVEHLHDVERIAPGIRPIRITFVMLWDALCRAIPSSSDRSPERPRSSLWSPDAACFA
jgi:hypothetical protein